MRNVGALNQQIALQESVETNDGGQLTSEWTDVETVWAEVITPHGTEALQSARENARESIRVRMHYRDDVTTAWRFDWMGQVYYVQHVDRSERLNGELWLTGQLVGAE